MTVEKVETLVIGGGQAGVAMSDHLGRQGVQQGVRCSRPGSLGMQPGWLLKGRMTTGSGSLLKPRSDSAPRRNRAAVAGIVVLALMVLLAAVGPFLVSFPYDKVTKTDIWLGPLRSGHLLGTDSLGRDLLARNLRQLPRIVAPLRACHHGPQLLDDPHPTRPLLATGVLKAGPEGNAPLQSS